jgi:hypothetical protein
MATDLERSSKKTSEILQRSITPSGLYPIDDTSAHTVAGGYAIQAISDTTIAAITATNLAGAAPWDLTGVVIPAGVIIYVKFSAITLTSGECICYQY